MPRDKSMRHKWCRIAWKKSEPLKLWVDDEEGHLLSDFDFIDIYEDGIHTIAVKDTKANSIFFVFRLKFEMEHLCAPRIQFVIDTDWYKPLIMETHDSCGFAVEDIMSVSYPYKYSSYSGERIGYAVKILVYTTTGEVATFYKNFRYIDTGKGMIGKMLEMSVDYEGTMLLECSKCTCPQELFDSKTALRLKLAGGGN